MLTTIPEVSLDDTLGEVDTSVFPHQGWFLRWRETLLLPNLKICIQHTYSKAMSYRNQMIDRDQSLSAQNQIVNIGEEQLATYLQKFSLKGILPQMPKILVTTYKGNPSIDTWLISYMYGLVFVFAQEFKVFDSRVFRLFGVQQHSLV
jgi:hypothetical protein